MSVFRDLLMTLQSKKPRLPDAYQEVEYIKSTGGQYIDTGVLPTNTYKIEIKFNCESFGSRSFYGGIYGGETSFNVNAFHLYRTNDYFDIGFANAKNFDGSSGDSVYFNSNTIYTISVSNGLVNINGTDYTGPSGTINPQYSVYLFALHRSQTFKETTCSKLIYYCKFYNNNVLVNDFVPCYRKSDGVIGMYDLVNNEFKTNIGSGTFGKGNDI